MSECANVEIRELLPELINDRLDAEARARVEAHVGTCAECAAELEALRVVHSVYARTPIIDTAAIVRRLPPPPAAARRIPLAPTRSRWGGSARRIAATVALVVLGGTSLVVVRRAMESAGRSAARASAAVHVSPPAMASHTTSDSGVVTAAGDSQLGATRPLISFAGGMNDLDAADLETLLGDLDRLDAVPVVEPEHVAPLVPVGTEEHL